MTDRKRQLIIKINKLKHEISNGHYAFVAYNIERLQAAETELKKLEEEDE